MRLASAYHFIKHIPVRALPASALRGDALIAHVLLVCFVPYKLIDIALGLWWVPTAAAAVVLSMVGLLVAVMVWRTAYNGATRVAGHAFRVVSLLLIANQILRIQQVLS